MSESREHPGLLVTAISIAVTVAVFWFLLSGEKQQRDATIRAKQWVRQIDVHRLVAEDTEGWKDEAPEAAQPPGSAELKDGLGEVYACETHKCWPRGAGATTARVEGKEWVRTIRTELFSSTSRSGWGRHGDRGVWPKDGWGGRPGATGATCTRKERKPRTCRTESKLRACDDPSGWCTEEVEKCTKAVFDDWCEWSEIRSRPGRELTAKGPAGEAPYWPAYDPASNESGRKSETNVLHLEHLAGPRPGRANYSQKSWETVQVGDLVWVAGTRAVVLPDELVPPDNDRIDCGKIKPETLMNRDRCTFQQWVWRQEDTRTVSYDQGPPDWPTSGFGDDTWQGREEWFEVEVDWPLAGLLGFATLTYDVEQWDAVAVGAAVPLRFDAEGKLLGVAEGFEPMPREIRSGRMVWKSGTWP